MQLSLNCANYIVMLTLWDNLSCFKTTISSICRQNVWWLQFLIWTLQLVLFFTYHLLTLSPSYSNRNSLCNHTSHETPSWFMIDSLSNCQDLSLKYSQNIYYPLENVTKGVEYACSAFSIHLDNASRINVCYQMLIVKWVLLAIQRFKQIQDGRHADGSAIPP